MTIPTKDEWSQNIMAKIAYILLCHKDPEAVIRQARQLTAIGDYVAIHFDASAPRTCFAAIRDALADNPNIIFTARRIRCGWGEWSLVQATLNTLRDALRAFPRASHFYMLSGDCMPIKTAEYVHRFLTENDADFIESFDYFESGWIKTGLQEERLIYRHWFNERSQKRRFYGMLNLQKRLGLTRKIPSDLHMMIGSQWWCLRRLTVEALLAFIQKRPDVIRFFRRTWIPDETFFQTLVRHLVTGSEIRTHTLTFLMFTDYGMPVVFHNDHLDLLKRQDSLFARKISPEAHALRSALGDLYARRGVQFQTSNAAAKLFRFFTTQGRHGRRFAPRAWETNGARGHERQLMVVICKKWHVAKRLLKQLSTCSNTTVLEYLFDEQATRLPDLGGIETTLDKRGRHRRALLRLLFDYYETDQMIICVDPSNFDLMEDFATDHVQTRFLQIDCLFSDEYLAGHARRVGLTSAQTGTEILDDLVPAIRRDILHEQDRIRDAGFSRYYHISERALAQENAEALANFLGMDPSQAADIAGTEYLFSD